MKKIKVIIKQPGRLPYVTHISNTLENLQKNVGGYIEAAKLCTDFVVICNEEGVINNMPFNCSFCGNHWFGPLIFAGVKGDEFFDVPVGLSELRKLLPTVFEVK